MARLFDKLTPINQRRLRIFLSNRRGMVCSILLLLIMLICLPAEFIANDKPLLIRLQGRMYFPAFVEYGDIEFVPDQAERERFLDDGILLETEPDYRDALFVEDVITSRGGTILWPIIPWSYDTHDTASEHPAPAPPSERHWLGTDDQGRDVVARAIYGLRLSMLFGFSLTIVSTIVGALLGLWQGYCGGGVDLTMQRVIEIWGSMPQLFLLIIMASIIPPGFWSLMGVMLLFSWIGAVGLVRAETLRTRNFEYVRAARALGMSEFRIALKHVLPNATVATLTFFPFSMAASLTALVSLDFLGLGLPPGSPSLGELLQQGKANATNAPWLGLTGFFVMASMLAMVVFVGEAARDALDPRKTLVPGK